MGLMQKAVETYDCFAHLAGVPRENHPTLTPVSHIIQRAQVEIALHSDGTFASATLVDEKTVIPATEESAGRASVPSAHPLSDHLGYVSDGNKDKHEMYLEGLSAWASSPFSHPKLKAVLTYVEKGTVVDDLVRSGILTPDEEGKLSEKEEKSMIRWRVLGLGEPSACWEDPELFRLFDQYYCSTRKDDPKELCMISGQWTMVAKNNPKGIIAAAYGAKLISANDSANFTYRGRFTQPREAATVGYTATQKSHLALQWVAADQGTVLGGRTFVCWNPKGRKTVNPIHPFGKFKEESVLSTPADYQKALYQTVRGMGQELPDEEDVVLAAFDAATTGRLSVTYYNEMQGKDFRLQLQNWYGSCVWDFGKFGYQSPSIRQIATCAFGVQRGEWIEADDRVLKEQVQRLLPCVVSGAPIPTDVMRALSRRVSMPQAYSGSSRMQLTSTACAVIRKYYNDKAQKEEYSMELDPCKKDRSYQYGRLLAVFEKIERDTYGSEENREPNAIRMQSVFSEKPLHAARILKERMVPYYQRLRPAARIFYDKLIGEIFAMLPEDDTGHSLGDTYILGYYLQKNALYQSNKNNPKNGEEQDHE